MQLNAVPCNCRQVFGGARSQSTHCKTKLKQSRHSAFIQRTKRQRYEYAVLLDLLVFDHKPNTALVVQGKSCGK